MQYEQKDIERRFRKTCTSTVWSVFHNKIGFSSISGVPQPLPEEITKFPTGFPLPKITPLNNSDHSWILNLLAAFSANQQSGTRPNKFYLDGAAALTFFPVKYLFVGLLLLFFNKTHILDGKELESSRFKIPLCILWRECVFVFLCEFALFGADLVSPFLGITLSRPAQILSEICRIVCLWKRLDIFPIHK